MSGINYIKAETAQSSKAIYPLEYVAPISCFPPNQTGEYMGTSGGNIIAVNINMEVSIMIMPVQQTQQDMSLMRNVISALFRNRDFLGYQLSYYKGNLTKKQFDIVKKKYLVPNNVCDVNILANNVYTLIKNTELNFDADKISTMFQCDIDVAEEALTKLENSLTT
jgi:hypothetical protein